MAIPFIDLKTQYKALKTQIDSRIQAVLEHGAFINGPEVTELEKKLCEFTGSPFALACSNGTDALLIPLMAAGIGSGDEVITTAFSFIATAEVIHLAGATPVYVDIDAETFNIDVTQLEKALSPKTKAIMPVSLYGQMADMDEINAFAKKHGLIVIEDAAQSFGAKYKGARSCSVSDFAGTSFFPAKPLGGYGDGGAIFCRDEKMYKAMKEIREHGSESRYYHTRLGMNARLNTIQCAVLLAKLERYQWEIDQRQQIANYLTEGLKAHTGKLTTPVVKSDRDSVWAQYTVQHNDRDSFQKRLAELGVPTAIHYPRTMPEQPYYQGRGREIGSLKLAKDSAKKVISLPFYPDMPKATQDELIEKVGKAL